MSKRKIPRLALAALTLGACASGNGDGEGNPAALDALSGGGQDVSQERTDAVVAAMCEQFNECDPSAFDEYYASPQECAASVRELIEDEGRDNVACKDAMLDYFSCFTKLSCEVLESEESDCDTLGDRVDEKCDSDDYDDSDYDPDDYDY